MKQEFDGNAALKIWVEIYKKDSFTAEHCKRVADLVEKFALRLGYTKEKAAEIKLAALIHDVGKLEIPDNLFEKMRQGIALSEDELKIIKSHTERTKILTDFKNVPKTVISILKSHHERFNGSGYPDGLKGKEIPEEVRILSIVDYYDSIVFQRPWKTPGLQKPLGKAEAIRMLIEEAYRRFDPELVKNFAEFLK